MGNSLCCAANNKEDLGINPNQGQNFQRRKSQPDEMM
jgi:hypothetical protein